MMTAMSMFWNIQLCGEEVRKYEVARGKTYAWVVRTRPDTAFRVPVRAPTEAALQTHGGFFCGNNDAFFVASAAAAPALFALHSLAHDCRWVGNSTLSRGLPADVQCGLRSRTTEGCGSGCGLHHAARRVAPPAYRSGLPKEAQHLRPQG